MVAPVRTREDFAALSRSRARGRSGPIWVVHAPCADRSAARVAYAVSKKVGGAVVRNRIRRRIRPVMDDLERTAMLVPGSYLVGVRPDVVDVAEVELRRHLEAAVRACTGNRT